MKKVLLIEDDKDFVELVEYILNIYGFEVKTHPTGLDVSDVVKKYNPNLILLDIQLPGKLGTEVCKDLKQTYDTPIILFSGQNDPENLVKECNADSYIEKPFDINELINAVSIHAN